MVDEAANEKEKAGIDKRAKEEYDKLSEEEKRKAAEKQREEGGKKKKEELTDKVKESKGFLAKALDLGYHLAMGIATTALGLATAGITAPIVAGAFAGGNLIGGFFAKKENKPSLYERVTSALRIYSVVNAILSPMIWLGDVTYPLINNATLLGKAARVAYAVGPYNMTFLTAFKAGDHLVKNKFDTTGMGKSIKDNWVPMYKRFAIGFSPGLALSANGIASIAGLPTFAYNALPLGIYNGINPAGQEKKEEKAQPKPAYPRVPQPGYQPAPA